MDEIPPSPPRRRHRPDELAPWVFLQHQVWVDRWGAEHEIESMPLDYVQAVIRFCHAQAHRILTMVAVDPWLQATHSDACMVDSDQPLDWAFEDETANEWLERTPLMIALRRREELLAPPSERET